MDLSIRPVTPQIMAERGAQAFNDGLGINDHDMNPGSRAILDWQAGWRLAERSRARGNQRMVEVSPP